MKQKIFFSILLAVLFFARPSIAARMVPIGTPLQPIPQNTAPNYSQSVNSPDSTYNQTQALDQKQISAPSPSPTPEVQPVPVGVPAVNLVAPSTEPVLLYWILLIVGTLGLIAVIAWLYYRFRQ
ncbi:MAG: hypothetical protein WDN47_02715 [Candidatus Doudnabacteria bacterium]